MSDVYATGYFQDTKENKIFKIGIMKDEDPMNPLEEWDTPAKLYCWHDRYKLGNENPYYDPEDFMESVKEEECVTMPLWLYDHSGITMRCGKGNPYSCQWDSGQVGYGYINKKEILEMKPGLQNENGEWEYPTEDDWERFGEMIIEQTVEEYDMFLVGDCYGYQVYEYNEFEEGFEETDDSCWGFFTRKLGIDLVREIAEQNITSETVYETIDDLLKNETVKRPTKLQKLEYERDRIEEGIANLKSLLEKQNEELNQINAEIEAERMVMA